MHKFDYSEAWQQVLKPDIVAMLTGIHEYKARLTLFEEYKAEALTQLSEAAKLKSAEASNKIEGISISDDRLKKLVTDKTRPRNNGEREIAGYRDVLATINESYAYLPFKPNMILQLHRNLFNYVGAASAGKFKASNAAVGTDENEYPTVDANKAREAPQAVEALCSAFEEILKDSEVEPLIIIPMAVFDFTRICPFDEGNGRMSRLIALLLLYRAGYTVGKYISVENLMEQSREAYFNALRQSSCGWQENENDYAPFIRYFLGVVLQAYKEFFARTEPLMQKGVSKPERVAAVIKNSKGRITKTEILKLCPDVSGITVQRTLADLLSGGDIIKIGGGRYTQYIWNGDKD